MGEHPSTQEATTTRSQKASSPGVETVSEAVPAVESRNQLTARTWEDIADNLCCESRDLVEWRGVRPEWPYFSIDDSSQKLEILVERGERFVPRELSDILRSRVDQRLDASLPEGRLSFAVVPQGVLVASDKGEWGGGLVFFAGGEKRAEALSVPGGVLGLVATGPEGVIALQRARGGNSDAVCVSLGPDGRWRESARWAIVGDGAIGSDAHGQAVVATINGEVLAVDCSRGVESVATLPLVELEERSAQSRTGECISPMLEPTSVRRFADQTVAVTTRSSVTVVRPKPTGDVEQRWYGRRTTCTAGPGR